MKRGINERVCIKPVLKKFNINKKTTPNDRRGFTLLEILVVIVILGILAGAILVSMAGIRENAEKKSLMRTMGTIVRAAGACDSNADINRIDLSNPICNSGASLTYPALDSKLAAKGYAYSWSGDDLVGYDADSNVIIRCYVGSGTCEAL